MSVTDVRGGGVIRPPDGGEVTLQQCNVVVTLLRVSYGGLDIGRRWSWLVTVDGGLHQRPQHDLAHGTFEDVNAMLPLGPHGPCNADFSLRFRIRARQHASPLRGSGIAFAVRGFPCPTRERLVLGVPVCGRMFWWPPGRCRIAMLSFGFQIDATCATTTTTSGGQRETLTTPTPTGGPLAPP